MDALDHWLRWETLEVKAASTPQPAMQAAWPRVESTCRRLLVPWNRLHSSPQWPPLRKQLPTPKIPIPLLASSCALVLICFILFYF